MRILHLFADHKWTGPAEPVVNLCLALRQKGHDARLASRAAKEGEVAALDERARARGLEPMHGFRLERGMSGTLSDVSAIRRYIEEEQIEIVHVHTSRDHLLGGIAARRAKNRPVVVRSWHKGTAMPAGLGARLLMKRYVDGWITYTPKGLEEDIGRFRLARERTLVVEGAVDLHRFDPAKARPLREELGLPRDAVVAGIVARMQRHRRFGELMKGMAIAAKKEPRLRLLAVGRGTNKDEVAVEPAKKLGISDRVIFAGYRGEDFVSVLGAIDFKVFLVPGSDGSCRAVREAMAMGKPVLAARRGILPELVEEGKTGLLVDDTPENLAQGMLRFAADPALRERMGAAARTTALARFDPGEQAARIDAFYSRLATLGPTR